MYRRRLEEFGFAGTALAAIEAEVTTAVDRATETAKASPPPSAEILETELWADGGSSWRN